MALVRRPPSRKHRRGAGVDRLPEEDQTILGGLFGVGSFIVAGLGLAHHRVAPFLAFAIGCGQMVWIVVELAIIRDVSVLHPLFFGIGLVIAVTAVPWGWPTFQAWRANR